MSLLSDPLDTRIIKDAPLPYQKSLTYQKLFTGKFIDLKLLMHFLQNQGALDQKLVQKILLQSQQIFKMQPNLIFVNDPVSVIGDIHGQFYDLATIFKNNNFLETRRKYLFLGDYVDRGLFSLQVLIFILAMKINSPNRVILLRGNHQSRQLTTYFNFRNQCLQSYNQEIYNKFIDLFNTLPIAAIVNRKFLCMHGGISTLFESVYRKKYRFCQIPTSGLFCDLLWADPINHPQGKMKELTSYNQLRGCSVNFGYTLTKKILQITKMSCIIRAHQAKQEGYQMHKWSGIQKFPLVITIFSAPNYCDFYNNKGAYIFIENNILEIRQIQKANHPFFLPNNLTLFNWTIPFISQKITQMFDYLLKLDFQVKDQIQIQLVDKRKIIQELLKLQNEDAEQKMKLIKYNGKVIGQQLMQIQKARQYVLKIYNKNFNYEKQIDKANQRRPESIEKVIETIYNYQTNNID